MLKISGLILSVPVFLSLAACSPMAVMLRSSTPVVQIAAQLDQAKLVADGVSYVNSGKTVSDHIISRATGNDCRLINILDRNTPVCTSPNPEKSSALETN